ncbi:hypothetical protein Hypma_006926 [Hypsizygus marmoreus]|uniref:Uncharacterized protein n=1 Tax=Hypsizygus marmoreus TaxID=39966 RepID=A0A369JYX4_HYPMA|nr:hypothetical protein Hypma_006926 [Hypsizygus marmoreus]
MIDESRAWSSASAHIKNVGPETDLQRDFECQSFALKKESKPQLTRALQVNVHSEHVTTFPTLLQAHLHPAQIPHSNTVDLDLDSKT